MDGRFPRSNVLSEYERNPIRVTLRSTDMDNHRRAFNNVGDASTCIDNGYHLVAGICTFSGIVTRNSTAT
jgi:hypothetical protein